MEMLKPNWKQHAEGRAHIGAITFMLADLHVRALRLEGKGAEADAFEASRTATEQALLAEKRSPWAKLRGALWPERKHPSA